MERSELLIRLFVQMVFGGEWEGAFDEYERDQPRRKLARALILNIRDIGDRRRVAEDAIGATSGLDWNSVDVRRGVEFVLDVPSGTL